MKKKKKILFSMKSFVLGKCRTNDCDWLSVGNRGYVVLLR